MTSMQHDQHIFSTTTRTSNKAISYGAMTHRKEENEDGEADDTLHNYARET